MPPVRRTETRKQEDEIGLKPKKITNFHKNKKSGLISILFHLKLTALKCAILFHSLHIYTVETYFKLTRQLYIEPFVDL